MLLLPNYNFCSLLFANTTTTTTTTIPLNYTTIFTHLAPYHHLLHHYITTTIIPHFLRYPPTTIAVIPAITLTIYYTVLGRNNYSLRTVLPHKTRIMSLIHTKIYNLFTVFALVLLLLLPTTTTLMRYELTFLLVTILLLLYFTAILLFNHTVINAYITNHTTFSTKRAN